MINKQQSWASTEDSIQSKLPLTVTRITVQKKNSDRYSLFHDDLFLIGINRKTLEEYSIQEGITLTFSLFQKLCEAEDLQSIREACFRYLSRRDHSAFELEQKVGKKGFPQHNIIRVIEDLTEKGYIDDEEFTQKFVSEKIELNRWGPRKIQSALFKKGINRKIIEKVLHKKTDDLQLQQICVDLVMKRKQYFLKEKDSFKRKQKIFRYLAGRGFSTSVTNSAYPQIKAKMHA